MCKRCCSSKYVNINFLYLKKSRKLLTWFHLIFGLHDCHWIFFCDHPCLFPLKNICKVLYGQLFPKWESTSTVCGVNYSLLQVMLLKKPNRQHLVAVDHNQLRTKASVRVDSIDWPLPSFFTEWGCAPPERHLHSTNRCSLCHESNDSSSRQPPWWWGNRLDD